MSRFLGPIHHWLFNKIVLFEKLEGDIINNIEKSLKTDINDVVQSANNEFGNPLPNMPLENLIDTNNIHGWLQSKINIAESRQAKIISVLINKYGTEAFETIKSTYIEQARNNGINAKAENDVSTPDQMFKTINNYILDGMPCDNANNITINDENLLEWKVVSCLHKKYWDLVNGDINIFYKLREAWISEFVNNANINLQYTFDIKEIEGNQVLIHQIKK